MPRHHAADPAYLTLTAGGMHALGLTYTGIVSVPSSSGPVQAMHFTMSSGTATTLVMTNGCGPSVTDVTSAGSASFGATSFDALSLAVTVGGTPVVFTVAAPPTAPFPADVVLQDVTLSATSLSTDTLSAPSITMQAAPC